MIVAVFLALHDELGVVPGQEYDGVLRLHIALVGFMIELCNALTRRCIVAYQVAVVLVAVQLKHVDLLRVRTPSYIGEISVGRVASLQVDGASRL